MKAVRWHGKHHVSVDTVPDPTIQEPTDAIIKITSTAICGSDLHLYDGLVQTMEDGDILGHEFMGEVVEVGSEVKKLKIGDRVVVPFTISCGHCFFCERDLFGLCDESNPNGEITEDLYGAPAGAIYGYSHMYGGFAGGQAQYARVPYADVGPIKVPDNLTDEQVLFLSDIYPTGYQAAVNCSIKGGETVAIWGAGPVGQMAIRSAYLLGAERVISIDNIPERLLMAQEAGAETINFQNDDERNLFAQLKDKTSGRGPDACVDAVGMEAHGTSPGELYDWVKMGLRLATDRPNVLRQAIQACRKGGVVSVPGVYAGLLDKIPYGAFFGKGLSMHAGQTHVQKFLPPLMETIAQGKIDPSFVITHRLTLDEAPDAYETFKHKKDGCIKVVLKPWEEKPDGKIRAYDDKVEALENKS